MTTVPWEYVETLALAERHLLKQTPPATLSLTDEDAADTDRWQWVCRQLADRGWRIESSHPEVGLRFYPPEAVAR